MTFEHSMMAFLPSEPDDWQRVSFGDFEFGEVSWLRRDERFEAGFFRVDLTEYKTRDLTYTIGVDQFGIVLEGGCSLEVDGEGVELGVGDVISISCGATVRIQWSGDRFREFFIQVYPESTPRPDTDQVTSHSFGDSHGS